MLQVIKNGGCNKIDPSIYPRHDAISRRFSDLEEREKCREYWKQAESTIVATLPGAAHEEFKKAYRIKINHLYCYKEELFSKKGWCQIAPELPGGPDPNQWGFCSTSCNIDFLRVVSLRGSSYGIKNYYFGHF